MKIFCCSCCCFRAFFFCFVFGWFFFFSRDNAAMSFYSIAVVPKWICGFDMCTHCEPLSLLWEFNSDQLLCVYICISSTMELSHVRIDCLAIISDFISFYMFAVSFRQTGFCWCFSYSSRLLQTFSISFCHSFFSASVVIHSRFVSFRTHWSRCACEHYWLTSAENHRAKYVRAAQCIYIRSLSRCVLISNFWTFYFCFVIAVFTRFWCYLLPVVSTP